MFQFVAHMITTTLIKKSLGEWYDQDTVHCSTV